VFEAVPKLLSHYAKLLEPNIESFKKNAKIYGLTPEQVLKKLRSQILSPKQTR